MGHYAVPQHAYCDACAALFAWKLSDKEEIVADHLSVVHHSRIRKHCQLYRSYRDLDSDRRGKAKNATSDKKVDLRLLSIIVATTLSPDRVAESA